MIDASRGFMKDGDKNRLRAQDIHKIVDVFTRQPRCAATPASFRTRRSRHNDYNLNIPRYIDASEPEDIHDLDAHLNGGIPDRDVDASTAYWRRLPEPPRARSSSRSATGYQPRPRPGRGP